MKIYSMTATFGNLEHASLTLKPGLNIIEAPNEWGKSTWCAFLVTMLYGLDTRAKTTKASLADKERFAPWSGAPMSGRIDLNWEGRDITIERSTKGRTPMGAFKAYETTTGLDVPELTATNCGQVLLGVERSVFTRSAFLRFSDLPVTQDDALRHRLNALVTTGDESGAAEALGQKLRELKNRCRYNKSGLLPQAEAQRRELEQKLDEFHDLTDREEKTHRRLEELKCWAAQLENHIAALEYQAVQADEQQMKAAFAALDEVQQKQSHWERVCADLPRPEEAMAAMAALDALHQDMAELQAREQNLLPQAVLPDTPACFAGIRPQEVVAQAEQDAARFSAMTEPKKPLYIPLFALPALAAVAGVGLLLLEQVLIGVALLLLAAVTAMIPVLIIHKHKRAQSDLAAMRKAICLRYGSDDPAGWVVLAKKYLADWERYEQALALHRDCRQELDERRQALQSKAQALSGRSRSQWQEVLSCWTALEDAKKTAIQAQQHCQALQSVIRTVPEPREPDALTCTAEQTRQYLSEATYEQQQLQKKLGQYQGQMEAMGSRAAVEKELEALKRRIHALEQTNAALEQALDALTAARQQLQRRFAPRITRRAQGLFAQLTGGRYDQFVLGEDLSVQAAARDEDVLHSQQWRSDGTVDQLYLALRLAVAQELIPQAPLVLDDALVRFDDVRLAAALTLLGQMAENTQVILFTCHSREKTIDNQRQSTAC